MSDSEENKEERVNQAARSVTFRVGILGIDGSGKSTLVAGLEQRFSPSCTVMSIGQRVTLHVGSEERHDLLGTLPQGAHPLRHVFRNLQRHWMLQRLPALLERYRPDLCLEDRDGVIDVCALVTAHIPALRFLAPQRRVRTAIILTRRGLADMYLVLNLPAEVAEQRILEKLKQTRRPRSYHEKRHRLERVAGEYLRLRDYLAEIGVPAVTLDASLPAATVLDAAWRAIRDAGATRFQAKPRMRSSISE